MKRIMFIIAIPILALVVWLVLSITPPSPVYSFAQFQAGVLHNAQAWSGRTVLVEGTIQDVGGNCPSLCKTPVWTHSYCSRYLYCSGWEELHPPLSSVQRDRFLLLRPGHVVRTYYTRGDLVYDGLRNVLSHAPSFIPIRLAPRIAMVYKIRVLDRPYCAFIGAPHLRKWKDTHCDAYGVLVHR